MVALVNSERAKVGCSPVALNAKLSQAAQAHSADMASHNTMSHTGSDGSDPGQRITRAGYLWSTYGENVAYGYSTPEQVMAGWMASAGHKRNILDCGFKEIGVEWRSPATTGRRTSARPADAHGAHARHGPPTITPVAAGVGAVLSRAQVLRESGSSKKN